MEDARNMREAFPWHIAMTGIALMLIVAGFGVRYHVQGMAPVVLGHQSAPASLQDLDAVLAEASLPLTFTYAERRWDASHAMRIASAELVPTERRVLGIPLYVHKDAGEEPFSSVYLRGVTPGYHDVYVKYLPAGRRSRPSVP